VGGGGTGGSSTGGAAASTADGSGGDLLCFCVCQCPHVLVMEKNLVFSPLGKLLDQSVIEGALEGNVLSSEGVHLPHGGVVLAFQCSVPGDEYRFITFLFEPSLENTELIFIVGNRCLVLVNVVR